MTKLYTPQELLDKYKGKYIRACPVFDYGSPLDSTRTTITFEVTKVARGYHEQCATPEQILTDWGITA